jgi:hypothetical protein
VCGVSEKAEVSFYMFDPALAHGDATNPLGADVAKSGRIMSSLDLRL